MIAAFIAAALNVTDRRALVLALAVGLSIVAPIDPDMFCDLEWYMAVSFIDLSVAVFALMMRTRASAPLFVIHSSLMLLHLLQSIYNPYADQPSYYTPIVQGLEMLSLLVLCYTSKPINRHYHGLISL